VKAVQPWCRSVAKIAKFLGELLGSTLALLAPSLANASRGTNARTSISPERLGPSGRMQVLKDVKLVCAGGPAQKYSRASSISLLLPRDL